MFYPYLLSGCSAGALLSSLFSHRKKVPFRAIVPISLVFATSVANSGLAILQQLLQGRKVSQTSAAGPPLFIVGHWGSGTTLLHELFSLDPECSFPNNYCCFLPNHFLLTERWLGPSFNAFAPHTRPMDPVSIGWDFPQEDEIGLLNLGSPSAYWQFVFPDHHDSLANASMRESQSEQSIDQLVRWIKALSVRSEKRLVLKSPTHSHRILELRERFPDAKFVHIRRDEGDVLRSTLRMITSLTRGNCLGVPLPADWSSQTAVRANTLRGMKLTQKMIEHSGASLPREDFLEIQFEELLRDPIGEMQAAYLHLNLPWSSELESRIAAHLETEHSN